MYFHCRSLTSDFRKRSNLKIESSVGCSFRSRQQVSLYSHCGMIDPVQTPKFCGIYLLHLLKCFFKKRLDNDLEILNVNVMN